MLISPIVHLLLDNSKSGLLSNKQQSLSCNVNKSLLACFRAVKKKLLVFEGFHWEAEKCLATHRLSKLFGVGGKTVGAGHGKTFQEVSMACLLDFSIPMWPSCKRAKVMRCNL